MTSYSLEYSCILFRYFRSVEEHLKYSQSPSEAHRYAFSLFGSVWELLEGSVWLFGIAESLSYDIRTILHFADAMQEHSQGLLKARAVMEVHSED